MISENIYSFLADLKISNNREWFEANRKGYETAKKEFEIYVNQLIAQVSSFDSSVANLTAKDAIFRIFRDVRFSKDKTPYKPNFGASIMKGGRKSYNAGYYLHIEAGGSFIAGGAYVPEAPVLKAIRQEIYYNPKGFIKIVENKAFKKYFDKIYGEQLKTNPKGYDKDFEHIELLRYKSYTLIHYVDDEQILENDFSNYVLEVFKAMLPFNNFLNEAIKDVDISQLRCK